MTAKLFNTGPVSFPFNFKIKKIVSYINSIDTYLNNKDYPDLILADE